jgi:hypothetical protein
MAGENDEPLDLDESAFLELLESQAFQERERQLDIIIRGQRECERCPWHCDCALRRTGAVACDEPDELIVDDRRSGAHLS